MSKSVMDIIGRMFGDVLALRGMSPKLEELDRPSNPTRDELGPMPSTFPASATHEEYAYVKKLLEEISGSAKSASEEIDKILKVPPPPLSGQSQGQGQGQGQASSQPSHEESKAKAK